MMLALATSSACRRIIYSVVSSFFLLLFYGCNGSASKLASDDINHSAGKIITLGQDNNFFTHQSAELVLFYPDESLSNIHWQQTAGVDVSLLTKNSKVIAFTPTISGNYSFEVSFTLSNGQTQTASHSITVNDAEHKISARLGHTVLSDNNVSLRAFVDSTIDVTTLSWQQIDGNKVTFEQSGSQANAQNTPDQQLAIFFTAPSVTKDMLLSFEVSATDSNNQQHRDQVVILVEPATTINANAYFEDRVATVFPYQHDNSYTANLVNCVYSNSLTSSCTLVTLPLLASENSVLSVDEIMARVVVSHQWMGDRFKNFLLNRDNHNDFKRLLRATTAIVISYDIRPSFYWAATGAIYLDPENLWVTADERDTINEAPDYRSDFGNSLQFVMPWRYVKNNDYAYHSSSREQRVIRDPSESEYRLAALLYHELAHANDFFPSNEWLSHQSQSRVLDAALSTDFESDQLTVLYPLASETMRALAQVSFAGESATIAQESYLPADIQSFFSEDVASDFYAYSSEREDYAMLFEELMMKNRYEVDRDVAITNLPSGDNITSADYRVTWGQRGRIANEQIKPRVAFSAARVLPEFDHSLALSQLPTLIQMTSGQSWLENLTISPSNTSSVKQEKQQPELAISTEVISNRYFHKALPKH